MASPCESGITQVIDLRKADSSEKLPRLCDKYKIEYFHYPVDNDKETIVKMVELMPELCKRIDKGNFYIACAMGLHRTDITLCVYWVLGSGVTYTICCWGATAVGAGVAVTTGVAVGFLLPLVPLEGFLVGFVVGLFVGFSKE